MNWSSLHGDSFRGLRVLVTGAAGFIGSHLVEALVELGAEVVALDDLSRGDWTNIEGFDSDVEKITASILDTESLAAATQGCAYVFHQAALGSVPLSVEQPMEYHEVNVMGTANVLQAARAAKVRRVTFAASSSAYGDPPDAEDRKETDPTLPRSPYAATKVAGEASLRAWAISYGLDTVALRYFNVFGPRQNPDSAYAAVIAAFAKALQAGHAGTITGTGEQSRDFTYVANTVQGNLLAALAPKSLNGEVINVAMGQRVTVNELHEKMARFWNLPDAKPTYIPARAGDVMHTLADIGRARELLNYEPLVDFDPGLDMTCRWYRDHLS